VTWSMTQIAFYPRSHVHGICLCSGEEEGSFFDSMFKCSEEALDLFGIDAEIDADGLCALTEDLQEVVSSFTCYFLMMYPCVRIIDHHQISFLVATFWWGAQDGQRDEVHVLCISK